MSRARTRVRLELGPKSHVKVRKKENGNSIRSTVVASCCCTYVLSPSLSLENTHTHTLSLSLTHAQTLSLSLTHAQTHNLSLSLTHAQTTFIWQSLNLSIYLDIVLTTKLQWGRIGKYSHMQRAKSYWLIYLGRLMNIGTP